MLLKRLNFPIQWASFGGKTPNKHPGRKILAKSEVSQLNQYLKFIYGRGKIRNIII